MNSTMQTLPVIVADHREQQSGIPGLLLKIGAMVNLRQLVTGDYIINDEMVVERKSADDFIQSLVSIRLFTQCARLVKTGLRPFLLLEGNPFQTNHQVDQQAIKGALLSVIASWQIPVIYSKDKEDSADQLLMLAKQEIQHGHWVRLNGYKPKKLKNHRLRFLQGLPNTGPVMAFRLYEHFGSIEAVMNADIKELLKVEGIGKKSAEKIRVFVSGN
jgi:DNA excision repair protein ERCC-4